MVVAAIKQTFQDYYDELPCKIIPTIAGSAGITFAISLLFKPSDANGIVDMSRPLLKAGAAALASAIHALMTPLFNQIFGKSHTDNAFNEMIKSCIIGAGASALMGGFQSSLQLTAFKLYYLISLNSVEAWFGGTKKPLPNNSIYLCF